MVRRHSHSLLVMLAALIGGSCSGGCNKEVGHEELLLKQLADSRVEERRNATLTLQESRPVTPVFLPALMKALDDVDPLVRVTAARAIGNMGPDGRSKINELVKLSNEHPDVQVRAALQDAIMKINSPQ
jgi:HEAT repeat protein